MSETSRCREPIFCAVCLRSYSNKSNLQRHIIQYSHDIVKTVPEEVKTILPTDLNFTLATYNRTSFDTYFLKIVSHDIANGESVNDFVKKFGNINNCVYVLRNSNKKRTLYRGLYKCQHAPRQKENLNIRYSKTTNCKSSISATITKDLDRCFCTIAINFDHNHSLTSTEALRHRKPDAKVVLVFEKMFDRGLSPIEALTSYKNHIRLQSNDVSPLNLAGRNQVPDYDWVRHKFNKLFKKNYGSFENAEAVRALEEFVARADPNECVLKFLEAKTKNEFVVAILTPLMKRVLQIQISGEVAFVDTAGSVDVFGLKVYVIVVKTDVGGMPGGVVVTTSEQANAIAEGFKLLLTLTDQFSFGGRGSLGPSILMMNDSVADKAALQKCFANTKFYLCIIHFLQATYRWLSHSENGVNVDERKIIYSRIKNMAHAQFENILDVEYKRLTDDFGSNAKLGKYIKRMYANRRKWVTCYREDVPMKNSNIYTTIERQMRISKEQIFNRIKARAPAQLVDFLLNSFDKCFKMKLIDVSLGKLDSVYWYADNEIPQQCDDYCYTQDTITTFFYDVLNKKNKNKYIINADVGVCSCYDGINGMFCKHQRILSVFTESVTDSSLLVSTDAKLYLYYLATGSRDVSTLSDPSEQVVISNESIENSNLGIPIVSVVADDEFVAADAGAPDNNSQVMTLSEAVSIKYNEEATNTNAPDNPSQATSSEVVSVSIEYDKETNELEDTFKTFVDLVRAEKTFGYLSGVKSFTKKLKRLNSSTAEARLAALHNFSRHVRFMPRKKTQTNNGRQSSTSCHRSIVEKACFNDHDYN